MSCLQKGYKKGLCSQNIFGSRGESICQRVNLHLSWFYMRTVLFQLKRLEYVCIVTFKYCLHKEKVWYMLTPQYNICLKEMPTNLLVGTSTLCNFFKGIHYEENKKVTLNNNYLPARTVKGGGELKWQAGMTFLHKILNQNRCWLIEGWPKCIEAPLFVSTLHWRWFLNRFHKISESFAWKS